MHEPEGGGGGGGGAEGVLDVPQIALIYPPVYQVLDGGTLAWLGLWQLTKPAAVPTQQ